MKINLRRLSLLVCLLFVMLQAPAQNRVHRYVEQYRDLALAQMKDYQIPASVILGVSIVESGAGTSKLARHFHNYFGVKGSNKNSIQKLGYKSAYKEYSSVEDSYDHFCRILKKKRFYSSVKGDADYKLWLKKMNEANYSTDKQKWVNKVTAVIRKYKLYEYDTL